MVVAEGKEAIGHSIKENKVTGRKVARCAIREAVSNEMMSTRKSNEKWLFGE